MNIKSIISKLIILLIVAFTAISVFWFFKTSSVKKHILALTKSSNGTIVAGSLSVTGFPLKQQVTVEELRFNISPFNFLPESSLSSLPGNLISNNKYQIQIKKLTASASIFSGDFKIDSLEDVAIRDQSGMVNGIQFNQAPVASFSISSGIFSKLSYQDSGYKILDAGKNVLFENGNSLITFESSAEGDKQRHKVKAEFKDVGGLSFSHDMGTVAPAPSQNPNADLAKAVEDAVAQVPAPTEAQPVPVVAPVPAPVAPNSLVKKSFSLEAEYVVVNAPAVASAPSADVPPVNVPVAADDKAIESIHIKNFEIVSPLYKVSIYGEVKPLVKDGSMLNLSAKIEKLDNVLTYIKRSIVNIPSSDSANKIDNVNDIDNTQVEAATTVSPSDSTGIPAATQKPEADVGAIIKDLSRKNAATNDEVAMFDFRQEVGKDLMVNEIAMKNIVNQIFMINPETSPTPTSGNTAAGSASAVVVPAAPIPAAAPINAPAPAAPAPAPAAPAPVPTPVAPAPAATSAAPASAPANAN